MPGPMLTATVSEVMKRGFVAGPLIIVGHGILELALLFGLIAGLDAWLTQNVVLMVLSLVGGTILIFMGVHMAWTSRRAADASLAAKSNPRAALHGPVLAGILTSLSNPYWTLWWATIGLSFVATAWQSGRLGLVSFYSGHILSDLTWYALVAGAVASGRKVCPPMVYRGVLVLCGVVLVGLGAWFLVGGLSRLQGS